MKRKNSHFFLLSALLALTPVTLWAEVSADSSLRDKQWIHGAEDCQISDDPAIEVHRYDDSSYILRQSKCLDFEAPFMYLLLGTKAALLLDSGATKNAIDFPLYDTVRALLPIGRSYWFTHTATEIIETGITSSKASRA